MSRSRSAAARAGWETRWSNMLKRGETPTGPKGEKFAEKRAEDFEYDYEGPAWETDWEWSY